MGSLLNKKPIKRHNMNSFSIDINEAPPPYSEPDSDKKGKYTRANYPITVGTEFSEIELDENKNKCFKCELGFSMLFVVFTGTLLISLSICHIMNSNPKKDSFYASTINNDYTTEEYYDSEYATNQSTENTSDYYRKKACEQICNGINSYGNNIYGHWTCKARVEYRIKRYREN